MPEHSGRQELSGWSQRTNLSAGNRKLKRNRSRGRVLLNAAINSHSRADSKKKRRKKRKQEVKLCFDEEQEESNGTEVTKKNMKNPDVPTGSSAVSHR